MQTPAACSASCPAEVNVGMSCSMVTRSVASACLFRALSTLQVDAATACYSVVTAGPLAEHHAGEPPQATAHQAEVLCRDSAEQKSGGCPLAQNAVLQRQSPQAGPSACEIRNNSTFQSSHCTVHWPLAVMQHTGHVIAHSTPHAEHRSISACHACSIGCMWQWQNSGVHALAALAAWDSAGIGRSTCCSQPGMFVTEGQSQTTVLPCLAHGQQLQEWCKTKAKFEQQQQRQQHQAQTHQHAISTPHFA